MPLFSPKCTQHLTRAIRVCALIALVFYAVKAYPAAAGFGCGKIKPAFLAALSNGYAYLATGAERSGFALNLFLNVNTGQWLVIGVDDNLNACTLMQGQDWRWALQRQA